MDRIHRDDQINEATLVGLIRRAQQLGDPAAFDGLYLLYADRVFRFLVTRLSDSDSAEEITAQVFLRLIEKIGQYQLAPRDNAAIFTAWLYRMAHNKMIDVLRRQRQGRHVSIQYAEAIPHSQPMADIVEERVAFEQVMDKLHLLNEQQRQVILLRFIEGYSIAETALMMDKSEGAIKALQHRSLESLRRYLVEE
jgi:RNA polymerase sigma-70 factor (ECF subfamily)